MQVFPRDLFQKKVSILGEKVANSRHELRAGGILGRWVSGQKNPAEGAGRGVLLSVEYLMQNESSSKITPVLNK